MRFILTILFLVSFYGISTFLTRPFIWLSILIMLVFTIKKWDKHDKYENIIVMYSLFVICSCFYSHFFYSQPLVSSIEHSRHNLGILAYFVAKGLCSSADVVKKRLKILMTITIVCYILQWIVYPTVLFAGSINDFDITDNQFRMRFYCSILFYLAFLYGINKYIIEKKIFFLLYTVIGFLPIIIMGFRSLIAMLLLSALLLIFKVSKKGASNIFKYLIIGSIAFYSALQIPIVQDKIDEMAIRQETGGTFDNKDYVRNVGLVYYSTTFSEKPLMWILGGGDPQVDVDGKPINDYQRLFAQAYDMFLYWNDLGLIGLSFIIGIIAVSLLVYLCIKTMYDCGDSNLQYIRFCVFAVLVGTIITSMELYRNGNLVMLGILMYIVHAQKQKEIVWKNNK